MNLKKISRISAALLMIFQLSLLPMNQQKAYAAEDVSTYEAVDSTYEFIRELEGFSSECLWDVNQWTIGYGTKCPFEHTCNGSYQHQKGGHTVTEEQARELVKDLMGYFVNTVKSNCKGLSMEQNQFDALVSAAYNHGNVNACPLKYYLQGTLSAEEARAQYLNWYVLPGSMYEQGLRNRREREANLFFNGAVAFEDSCSEEYAGTYTTKNVTSYLNIRSEGTHSLSSPSIGKIYPNEIFTVTKASGNIAHVNYNGITGIVCMDYIQRVPETTTVEQNDADANNIETVVNEPVSTSAADKDGCSEEYAGTYTTKNVTSYLNLRSESTHSLSGAVIGKIYPNEKFTVTKANGSIAHVNYNGITGIVCMDYIQRVPEAAAIKQTDGDVNSDNVVDARDATVVLSVYSKISAGKGSDLNETQQKAADANKDGTLDGRDATTILSYYAKQSAGGSGTISEYLASLNQ